MGQFQKELEVAEAIAREAGAILLGLLDSEPSLELKAGHEPVTEADCRSNDFIVRELRGAFPSDAILAEESLDPEPAAGAERVWVVDPMDGTREFLAGTSDFSVHIGLAVGGRPELGVVFQPKRGLLFRGGASLPAQRVEGERVRSLRVSDTADLAAMRLTASRSKRRRLIERMAKRLGIERPRLAGSVGLKVCLVAAGECDLYPHPGSGTRLWDTCAPEAILAAAGGKITDFDGNPLSYDPQALSHRRGLLASNGVVHDGIVERLRGFF